MVPLKLHLIPFVWSPEEKHSEQNAATEKMLNVNVKVPIIT